MKKDYMKPDMRIVRIEHQQIICISDVDSNVGMGYGGGSSVHGRSRSYDEWDDEE